MSAAVLEAEMTEEQVRQLAELMEEGVSTRPAEVRLATLHYAEGKARLVAYWNSAEALDEYRASSPILRGEELMNKVGVQPTVEIVSVVAFG
ncbi:MAG: hypothetical protein JSU06_03155 [Actinobacteria bacterium]|nr:hypothetical protein [Actinomycetota bacterium]